MSKNVKTILGIIALIVIILLVRLVDNKKPETVSGEPIKIGALLGLTGDASVWGEAEKNGYNLAIDEINNNGGIDGRNVELVIEDTKNTNQGVVNAASKLINVDKLPIIFGPTWGDTYQGAFPLADQYSTLMITPSASVTAIHTEKVFQNVFSTYYRSDFQGKNYLDVVDPDKKIKSVYILIENDPYFFDMISYIEEKAKQRGIQNITIEKVSPHTTDFRTQLLEIKKEKPDMVFVGFYGDTGYYTFYKQKNELGLQDIKTYTYEGIAEFGPSQKFKGLLDNTAYVGFDPILDFFVEKYKKSFNTEPVFAASCAYDTVYILKQAIEATDGSVEQVRNYLQNKTFDTVTFGKTSFDEIHGVKETGLQLFTYSSEKGDFEIK